MCNRCAVHKSTCNGPLHREVNVDYHFAIFGLHVCRVVNAMCCYIALVRWMLKYVVDVGESSTDLEEIGKLMKRLIQEDAETRNIRNIEELQ